MTKRTGLAWERVHTRKLSENVEILEDFRLCLKDLDERIKKLEGSTSAANSAAQAALYVANRR